MKDRKELKVSAIKNGTVIDHVPAKNLFKVISILRLDSIQNQITFGTNLESKKLGSKAVIKVSNRTFEDHEINKIALVAPQANLNIIENYKDYNHGYHNRIKIRQYKYLNNIIEDSIFPFIIFRRK